ncbi:MAG: VPLPA-CTERM sorting domain-containing protein [Candidatus Omnitrophica bacterium]|nr:VPLPA-CTERM sorting domain-containing protein [Candidatus Omnitrophota bacterium]
MGGFFKKLVLVLLFVVVAMGASTQSADAAAIVSGFNSTIFPGNDDGSTALVPIGFTVNFFGVNRSSLFINNNGNVTFDSPLSTFTPFALTTTSREIIAPFFADVDTRAGNTVTYGSGLFDGRTAFGVNWIDVRHYNVFGIGNGLPTNSFQLLLVDRGDTGLNNFDIIFNYDSILWEAGTASGGNSAGLGGGSSARAGYSNGTGLPGTFFELPGSAVNGAFLDGNLTTGSDP